MRSLVVTAELLRREGRWDIDYHLPPEGLRAFPPASLRPVRELATLVTAKRDPTRTPEATFLYVDIASVNVDTGTIDSPQELSGEEAPSRARKVIRAYDLVISTCRPTRGAIAIVPERLHGQLCSTAFTVLRARAGVNPFFLHYALRLPSTLEQFRKWSTGSSYPAILDDDVLKTRLPTAPPAEQDAIAELVRVRLDERQAAIARANAAWEASLERIAARLRGEAPIARVDAPAAVVCTRAAIDARLAALGGGDEDAGEGS